MIDWFRMWARGVIAAVIIATVIEMALPNNNSKKYIKILIGIFIIYTIIGPAINQFSSEKIDDISQIDKYIEASSNNILTENEIVSDSEQYIKNIYKNNLEEDIKKKLEQDGYVVSYTNVKICDDDSYRIEKIDIKISEKKAANKKQTKTIVDNIREIAIKIDNSSGNKEGIVIGSREIDYIKKIISENYDVGLECINVS